MSTHPPCAPAVRYIDRYVECAAGMARPFLGVLGLPSVTVEHFPVAHRAIRMLAQGVDFADALHLASKEGAERLVTFDA